MDLLTALTSVLRDLPAFSAHLSGVRLRAYQQQVACAIADSVIHARGLTFVVIFPRQSGKNELQAQIETYLLALLQQHDDTPAEIVKVSPTWKPQSLNAMRRLERTVSRNLITRGRWTKEQGYIYRIGAARIYFLSGEPTANIVGATASTLLEVDEAQDVLIAKYDKDINPMAASTNATRVFWGTAWTSQTLLAREKRLALEAEKRDGYRRVFELTADQVRIEVPAYGAFVDNEIAKLGRNHPFVRTQYYSEEIDAQTGLFPPERLALIHGDHPAQLTPSSNTIYVFTIDVGGEETPLTTADIDAAVTTGPLAPHASVSGVRIGYAEHVTINTQTPQLLNSQTPKLSRHDSTVLTIFEIDLTTLTDPGLHAPTYKVVHRRAWTGIGQPQLYAQLNALANLWNPHRIVIDASGLGEGLAAFLEKSHPTSLLRFKFNQSSKSTLGWNFISIVESGRYKEHRVADPVQESSSPESKSQDHSSNSLTLDSRLQDLFFAQARACTLEILPGPGRTLRYAIPATARHPTTGHPLHDDLLLSAMLIAALESTGSDEHWGTAESAVIQPTDPFKHLEF